MLPQTLRRKSLSDEDEPNRPIRAERRFSDKRDGYKTTTMVMVVMTRVVMVFDPLRERFKFKGAARYSSPREQHPKFDHKENPTQHGGALHQPTHKGRRARDRKHLHKLGARPSPFFLLY